ncbi:MAG: hypothetical protein A2622_14095 [Bdellovibrionales bacterium RIFCSPHIGHO2_01_FULL_40_29]|nr:MAG: hypothetical protein A2622_14095 [Bdellovibrionales bacterium RIFCSPHIGHO2_01_FULL_40_29]OFZ33652.1 MAG: hypothetical protein A3D17_11705 [Bdellovibrionales bacterium RIFCSPHIGHO2_02_FULL_40_15]
MKLILCFLILIHVSVSGAVQFELEKAILENKLSLVSDNPNQRIQSLLLFLSSVDNIEMQSSLINQLGPGVQYHIVKAPSISAIKLIEKLSSEINKNDLHFYDFDNCFTPWVQDFFLRMTNGAKSFLLPTYSTSLQMNECRPYELGIADLLLKKNPLQFADIDSVSYDSGLSSSSQYDLRRVDRKNGELYSNHSAYQKLFPVKTLKLFQGEGGMRLLTEKYLFIERTDWQKIESQYRLMVDSQQELRTAKSYFESVFQKEIILIGETLKSDEFYSYHIDMFMTPMESPNGKSIIFLGHPTEAVKILGSDAIQGLKGFSQSLWMEKTTQANRIEAELIQKNFTVIRVPILFLNSNVGVKTFTYNNVLQSLDRRGRPALYIPSYEGTEIDIHSKVLEKSISKVLLDYQLQSYFVRGSKNFIELNGQLRCSSGILSYK